MVLLQFIFVSSPTSGVPVTSTVAHNLSGSRCKIKVLSFVWRPGSQSGQPLRIDSGPELETENLGGSIVSMNGVNGATGGGLNTYYTNAAGFGLMIAGSTSGTNNYQLGTPMMNGQLLGNTLTFTIRDATVPPGVNTGATTTASSAFGYAILQLDISKID